MSLFRVLPELITLQLRLISSRLQKRISSVLKPFGCSRKGSIKWRWSFFHFCVYSNCIKLSFDSDSFQNLAIRLKSSPIFSSDHCSKNQSRKCCTIKLGICTLVKDISCHNRKIHLPLSRILTSRRWGDRNSLPIDNFAVSTAHSKATLYKMK